ncbi:hypothetical protein [Methanorbis furvi]|uniref:Uncharacterized protein n=1 Tax=Methanorbis furvi TaxID=3028299 RepID=A0AAE4MEZ0_9EURY|nr:hypothetical protein [Methanocorpusculaceae archaeon Ag1]
MVAIKSRKVALGARVSREIYEKVRDLTEGENPPFESLSDYLNFVIAQDLARREMNVSVATYELMEALKDPELRAEFKRMLKD